MDALIQTVLKEFKRKVKAILKEKFSGIILFGSYARGDYSPGSDLDVLLLVKSELNKIEEEKLSELKAGLSLKFDLLLSCFSYPEAAWKLWETPFLTNVRREGLKI